MELYKDFKDLLKLLNKNKVEYVIVGGYAVAFHGYPRFTGDIDLYINPALENAKKMLTVLEQFGFATLKLSVDDFTKLDNVIQLGFPPVRIDLLTSISGVSWEEVFSNRVIEKISEIDVSFVGYDDLMKNKKATNRPKDIVDISSLTKEN